VERLDGVLTPRPIYLAGRHLTHAAPEGR